MNKFLLFIKSISQFLALPTLSGVLIGTSYIPFKGWALLFCYLPLLLQIYQILERNKKISQVFWSAWVTQFVLTLIGFNWIFYVSKEFGHLHWSLAAGAQIAFCAFMHLYIPFAFLIAAYLIRKLKIKPALPQFLIMALCLSLTERIWPSIFEWNLAYTFLWIKLPIYQWADTVGFWGLSTWLYITQAFLAFAYMTYKSNRTKSLQITAGVFGVVLMLNLVGFLKQKNWQKTNRTVTVGVAQGNIGNAEKLQSEKKSQFHTYIREVYTSLTDEIMLSKPAEIIIWPETALPFIFEPAYHRQIQQTKVLQSVQKWKSTLITGAYSKSESEKDLFGDAVYRNAVFYLSPNLNFAAPPYYKTNLLAFGEYMPLGKYFPFLYQLLPFVGTYADGSGPVVAELKLPTQTVRLGPQICYDSLAPGFSRDLALNGAQIVFNVTNDSWFGWWAEPFQHQYMTLARAIEIRRPLLRSTNTGVSSAILADGTVLLESPINEKWQHTYEIPFQENAPLSLYNKFGYLDWIVWLTLLIVLLIINRSKEISHVRS